MSAVRGESNTYDGNSRNGFCIFCYDENLEGGKLENAGGIIKQFITSLEDYVGEVESSSMGRNSSYLGADVKLGNELFGCGCCENCEDTLATFCREYHQLKCLEIKLEKTLAALASTMNSTTRTSARKGNKLNAMIEKTLDFSDSGQIDGKDCYSRSDVDGEKLMAFRQEMLNKCTHRRSKSRSNNLEPKTEEHTEGESGVSEMVCDVGDYGVKASESQEEVTIKEEFDEDNDENDCHENMTEDACKSRNVIVIRLHHVRKISTRNQKARRFQKLSTVTDSKSKQYLCGVCKVLYSSYKSLLMHKRSSLHLSRKFLREKKEKWKNSDSTVHCKLHRTVPNFSDKSLEQPNCTSSPTHSVGEPEVEPFEEADVMDDDDGNEETKDSAPGKVKGKLNDDEIEEKQLGKTFRCNTCSKRFISSEWVTKHQQQCQKNSDTRINATDRSSANLYTCPFDHCAQTFNVSRNLEAHKKLHGRFKCKFCSVVEEFAPDVALHESLQHTPNDEASGQSTKSNFNEGNFKCSRCSSTFDMKTMYIKHFLQTHMKYTSSPIQTCKICGFDCGGRNPSTERHFKEFHETEGLKSSDIYKCDQCSGYFIKTLQLDRHKYQAHFNCKCPTCGAYFSTFSEFKKHMKRSHSGPKDPLPKNVSQMEKVLLNIKKCHCDMCGVDLPITQMSDHVKGHVGEYARECPNAPKCQFVAGCPESLRIHLKCKFNCREKAAEKNQQFICEACGFSTDNVLALRGHAKRNHENRGGSGLIFECPIVDCEERFRVKQSVWDHLNTHAILCKTQQKCEHCSEKFKVDLIEEHLKTKHNTTEVFKCQHCSFVFSKRSSLIEHLFVHRFIGISCDMCNDNVKFTRHSELKNHYRLYHQVDVNGYKCGQCGLSFSTNTNLTAHKKNYHTLSDSTDAALTAVKKRMKRKKERFSCELCFGSVDFSNEDSLTTHKIKMHGADPFTCKSCGEKFTRSYLLYRHEREHAGFKYNNKFKCEIEGCGRIFGNQKGLKKHQSVTHEGNSIVCELCGKSYTYASGLKHHMRSTHLGLRPFICDVCGENFISSSVLKRHKLIHSGERPFACSFCGQRFRQKNTLQTHVISHEKKGSAFKPTGPMKHIRKRKSQ